MTLPTAIREMLEADEMPLPQHAARSMNDLSGKYGETWLVGGDSSAGLFSRHIGKSWEYLKVAWPDITRFDLRNELSYAIADIEWGGREATLKCSTWERKKLEALHQLWQGARGVGGEDRPREAQPEPDAAHSKRVISEVRPPPLEPTPAPPPLPAAHFQTRQLNAMQAFSAALYAVMCADDQRGNPERDMIATIVADTNAAIRGIRFYEQNGTEAVLAEVEGRFQGKRARCLLANMVAVALVDGLWRTAEQALIHRFRQVMDVPENDFQQIVDVLMTQRDLSVLQP